VPVLTFHYYTDQSLGRYCNCIFSFENCKLQWRFPQQLLPSL